MTKKWEIEPQTKKKFMLKSDQWLEKSILVSLKQACIVLIANNVYNIQYSIVKDSNVDLTVGNWESKIEP